MESVDGDDLFFIEETHGTSVIITGIVVFKLDESRNCWTNLGDKHREKLGFQQSAGTF